MSLIMDVSFPALSRPITAAAAFVLDHPLFSVTVAISGVAVALALLAIRIAAIPRQIHTTTRHPPADDDTRTRRRLHAIVHVERVPTKHP